MKTEDLDEPLEVTLTSDKLFQLSLGIFPLFRKYLVAAVLGVDPNILEEELIGWSTVIQIHGLPQEKQVILDCFCKFNETYFIIEMQNDVKNSFCKRMGFYGHAVATILFQAGQDYDCLPDIKSIAFLGESYFPGDQPFVSDISSLENINRASGIPVFYCQLNKLNIDIEKASLQELALAVLTAKTLGDLHKIRRCWKRLAVATKGEHLMDDIVARIERAQAEPDLCKAADYLVGFSELQKELDEAKAQLKAKEEEFKAQLKAKDEEHKAQLKEFMVQFLELKPMVGKKHPS